MKRSFLAACIGTLFFAACKEVPVVGITYGTGAAAVTDTTYVLTSVPAATAHQVLVEEFTGQACSNCPAGHAILDSDEVHYPGLINVIALFPHDNSPLTNPPAGAAYDFTSVTALNIANTVYGSVPQYPSAGIDRLPYLSSSGRYIADANWTADITSLLPQVDSLNMGVSSSYATVAGVTTATIVATVTYLQSMTTQQNLSVVVVADSIIDVQEFPFGTDTPDYVFNSVFVGAVSGVPYGDPLIDTITLKAPGRFVRSVYTYTVPGTFSSGKGAVNPAHCRVVAFVNGPGTGGNYQVYQSVQAPLGP